MNRPRFWRLQLLFVTVLVASVALWFGGPRLVETLDKALARSTIAQPGVIERTFVGQGFMVRSEIAVTSPAEGTVTLLVEDRQRVRMGQIVAEIREDVGPQVMEALNHLDEKVMALDQESHRVATEIQRTLDQLRRSMHELEEELTHALAAGRNDLADELSANLTEIQNEHAAVEMEFSAMRAARESERENLLTERSTILASAASTVAVVRAEVPGLVSLVHDGYEDVFSPGEAPDFLWTAVGGPEALESIEDGMAVSAGSVLLRLIDNFQSHVFVRFDEPPDFRRGQAVWLRWQSMDAPGVRARVFTIHNRENQVGVWFAIDLYQDDFALLRKLGPVTVVTGRSEGILLPRSALGQRGDQTGVYLVADGRPVFRSVNVLASDDERIIVDRVPAGTRVIVNPRRLFRAANAL